MLIGLGRLKLFHLRHFRDIKFIERLFWHSTWINHGISFKNGINTAKRSGCAMCCYIYLFLCCVLKFIVQSCWSITNSSRSKQLHKTQFCLETFITNLPLLSFMLKAGDLVASLNVLHNCIRNLICS